MATKLSRYTLALSAVAFAATIAVYTAVRILLAMQLETAATAVSDFGEAAVVLLAAVIVLRTALSFEPGERVRRNWLLIGTGIALFCVGDLIWAYIEVIRGLDTFPSLADLFYVAQYVFLLGGIVMSAFAYRGMMRLRWLFAASLGVSAVFFAVLWQFLIRDIALDPEADLLSRALSAFYPTADVFLLLLPALLIVLIAWKLGRGSFGWPWWPVALGLVLLAASDAGFAYLDWNELYAAGHLVDAGWMLAMTSIATGALVARDVFGVRKAAPGEGRQRAA